MDGSMTIVREGEMELHSFPGSPEEAGRAQGSIDPAFVRQHFEGLLERPHNFDHPYFRKNMAFMRREFPDLMEQLEAFGTAIGFENFDHTFYLHIYHTGGEEDGCSALGILLAEDGPAMLRTYDPSSAQGAEDLAKQKILSCLPDCRPYGFVGIGSRINCVVNTSVNSAGLLLGAGSGHEKFNRHDNPEHVNMYFTIHLLSQYCGDCDDVRHFLNQYRVSGLKGQTNTAVDARGNILGFELESENIAFREAENGMVLETNHWQHPDLQEPSRAAAPEFWSSPYYYNSQNRVQYLDCHREMYRQLKTIEDLIDVSFDVHAPGRILQMEGTNIADWATSHAIFMTSRDRKMRVHTYPLDKERYTGVVFEKR